MTDIKKEEEVIPLVRHDKVLVYCDCDASFPCVQGKRGAETRCQVWMEKRHVTQACLDLNRAIRTGKG